MLSPYLLIGEIVRPQGVRGEVKVRPYTDDPGRFQSLDFAFVKEGEGYHPIRFTGCRVQKEDVFLWVEGVESRDDAEKLRGVKLYIDRAHAKELGEDEVFIADILGARAEDTKGRVIGTLKEVLTPGGVDVFVIDTPKGVLMVPALKSVLLVLDAQNGRIVLDEQKLREVALYENSDFDPVPGDV